MDKCINDFFVFNGEIKESKYFELINDNNICIYEVIRIIDGVPLFFEEHIERFITSLKLKNININVDNDVIKKDIELLIEENNVLIGNIRYEWYIKENNINRYAYYIKHYYPTTEEYSRGVKLISQNALRDNPNVKQYNKVLRERFDKLIKDSGAFEILLVDDNGYVTEGNKSNIFFVKNDELYTAPDEMVLKGITRQKVIKIANDLNIKIKFEAVKYNQIQFFDAAFLTGTSPKVLKICCIDNLKFKNENKIIEKISCEYDSLIIKYISSHIKQ